jgi:hypothetical protein
MKKYIITENMRAKDFLDDSISSTSTVYLVDIDNEATVVIAKNIAEAMDKAEKIAKKGYKMIYSKSLPLLD